MNRHLSSAIKIVGIFVISLVIVRNNCEIAKGNIAILSDEFTVTYLGLLSGFSLTIIAFMYSNLERVRDSLKRKKGVMKNVDNLNTNISSIYLEIKDDTMYSLYSLVICIVSIIIRDMSFMPDWSWLGFNEVMLFYVIKLTTMAITTIALFDIATSTFAIINGTNNLLDESEN